MSVLTPVLESLARRPGKVVCRDPDRELTAGHLLAAGRAGAARLAAATPAGRIGLLLPISADAPPAVLAALWAGKVPVPLNPLLKPAELGFILKEAGLDAVVVARATAPLAAALGVTAVPAEELLTAGPGPDPHAAAPGDPAVVLYTSGTTGRPAGVTLTHANLRATAEALIGRLAVGPDDVFLAVLPVFHAFGLVGTVVGPWLVGAEVTYAQFTPDRAAAVVAERKVTTLLGVPSMYRLLARCKAADLSAVRLAISGGDALPASVRDGHRARFGRDLLEGYGMTETTAVVTVNVPGENRPGTAGRPVPGTAVRVVGDDGGPRPPGAEGDIQVHGPGVTPGYLGRPDETAAAFTPDGWLRTGDRGSLDADGYLTITGRTKELIVRDGEKVMPREVEDVLDGYPGVTDVAVVGEPDGPRGEAVVAFVVPAGDPPAADDLRAFCRGRLAEYKVPRRFVFAADLPRGPTGKILKRLLKDWRPPAAT